MEISKKLYWIEGLGLEKSMGNSRLRRRTNEQWEPLKDFHICSLRSDWLKHWEAGRGLRGAAEDQVTEL